MKRKGWLWMVGLLMLLLIIAACSSGSGDKPEPTPDNVASVSPTVGPAKTPEPKKDPFTMTIFAQGVSVDEFDGRFRPTLEKKFPHIKFEYQTNSPGVTIKELVATGKIPDVIRIDVPGLLINYLDYGIGEDLNPYVKKYNYDLKRFNPVFLNEIVDAAQTGELYGLPVPPFFPQVLYYNKGLFDKFGVPYPKDGISWDEVYELAKKLTRVDGATVYRGFSAGTSSFIRDNTFSNPILDPNKDGLADHEKWRAIFNNLLRFYQIPNNGIGATGAEEIGAFAKGISAMHASSHNIYSVIPPEIDWDMVSSPTLEGAPKLTGQRGPAYWSITKQGKHKDEAFQVIMEMLSDEVQMEDSKKGIPTTLNNKAIQNALGQSDPVYSKKNMKAISFYEPIMYPAKRKAGLVAVADGTQTTHMNNTFRDVALGKMDVNTALRTLDEKLKLEVEKAKAK